MPREVRDRNPVAPAQDSHALVKDETVQVDYDSMTVADLKGLAAQRGIQLPSKARKSEWVTALRGA